MLGRIAARAAAGLSIALFAAFCAPTNAGAQVQANLGSASIEPFGLRAVPVVTGEVLTKWSGISAEIHAESEILARCRGGAELCPAAAQKLLAVIADGETHQGRARIGVVNRAINLSIRPTSDLAQWGVADRWSAPLTTLATGRGDCEDYAIAKYVALREAGVAKSDVRLVIVRDLALAQDHAIVAARLEGRWLVLDNRRFILLEDHEMRRVVPLFVLDQDGVRSYEPVAMAEARRPTTPGGISVPAPAPGALGF